MKLWIGSNVEITQQTATDGQSMTKDTHLMDTQDKQKERMPMPPKLRTSAFAPCGEPFSVGPRRCRRNSSGRRRENADLLPGSFTLSELPLRRAQSFRGLSGISRPFITVDSGCQLLFLFSCPHVYCPIWSLKLARHTKLTHSDPNHPQRPKR